MALGTLFSSTHLEIHEVLPTSTLIKGEAHTGEYSLFLKHENQIGAFSLEVSEKKLLPFSSFEFESNTSIPLIQIADQTVENDLNYEAFENETGIDLTSYASSVHSLDIDLSTINGIELEDNSLYVISLWVRDLVRSGMPYRGGVSLEYDGIIYKPKEEPIDGWQKIEFEFSYILGEKITLEGGYFGALFDDIRIFPKDANMKSYVYDRLNNRLTAQLDENNFATFYEYDQEGNLFQVKKETSSGIITLSETRQSINKK
jgi:YD repeat-containing protein